jgi:hypothetical protein
MRKQKDTKGNLENKEECQKEELQKVGRNDNNKD